MRQFRLTEEEFDCTTLGMTRENYDEDTMYEALLQSIQTTVQDMVKKVLENNEDMLKKIYKVDTKRLLAATITDFHRISYEDAVVLLNKNGYPKVAFGDDLVAEHEAKVIEVLNKKSDLLPVFIMKYPKEIKFFNMKISTKDPRVALSADLIFPFAGEGTGSAVREHDFEKLNERLLTSNMYRLHIERGGKYEDFAWYLTIMKNKWTMPHAGYGIGNSRVLQYIFAAPDIRHVSDFSLLNLQTGDWDKKHYGQAPIVSKGKKNHILISIGKIENKRFLLPALKQLSKHSDTILYATQNTHTFLKENKVLSSLVHKISEMDETPNINDLMRRRVFDMIINIPTREKVKATKEFTDGKLIRKGAVKMGISLITDVEVAATMLENLAE